MIPCANPHAQYAAHRSEIDAALQRALDGGRYILGPEVEAFEAEFAAYLGVSHAAGVSSGTDAVRLAIAACGIGPGDEVITVAHTAVATVTAIEQTGAVPVLVDIDPVYFTIDPSQIEAAITTRTRAIVPVHLYGQPADLDAVLDIGRRHALRVIEDCAQAHGAEWAGRRLGSLGDMGCFSFYPTKNLGAIGDGGLVVTNDADLARRVRLLREYGWATRYVSDVAGSNSRLDEIQAAVLRVKLRYLDADNAARAALAAVYAEQLQGGAAVVPAVRSAIRHAWHLYVVRVAARDDVRQQLAERGIGALVHYPVPIHLQPAYQGRLAGHDRLPHTEQAAREVLSLPMYPELQRDDVATVADAVVKVCGGRG